MSVALKSSLGICLAIAVTACSSVTTKGPPGGGAGGSSLPARAGRLGAAGVFRRAVLQPAVVWPVARAEAPAAALAPPRRVDRGQERVAAADRATSRVRQVALPWAVPMAARLLAARRL